MRETVVVVSVDTEEDNWQPARDGVTVENIRHLPRLQERCDELGVPLTYFTTYQVASTPWAARVLQDLRSTGRAAVGAHLHPWNTPPLDEAFVPRNTMLLNLPIALQRAKLAALTSAIEQGVGGRPSAFRAGRFGLGRETTRVLIEQGYRVDSSVTPWISWTSTDEGPDFVGAPLGPYTLDGTTDPREPVPNGPLLEIPVSSGYSRWPFSRWHAVYMGFSDWGRPLQLADLAERIGVVRLTVLSPEVSSTRHMRRLARHLVAHGVPQLSVFFHSPSLRPALSPFSGTEADVERLFRTIADFVDALGQFTTPVFTTATGAAARLAAQGAVALTPEDVGSPTEQ
jgi:hypothetical protein